MTNTTEKYKKFYISLLVNPVKYTTINYSTAPKSHVKIFTYMNNDNGFDILVAVVFYNSPQLGGIGTKYQDLVRPFQISEGESLPDFHLRALQERSEIYLLTNKAVQINNLTGKNIM